MAAKISVEKALLILSFSVAAFMILSSGIDLATGWPFSRASVLFDVSSVICGGGLAYLSWNATRDVLDERI
jgi:hypothetical protein